MGLTFHWNSILLNIFSIILKIKCIDVCLCKYICNECRCPKRMEMSDASEAEVVSHPMWVLRTESWFSARVAHALNCRNISLVTKMAFSSFNKLFYVKTMWHTFSARGLGFACISL